LRRLIPLLLFVVVLSACSGEKKTNDLLESHYMLGVSYLRSGDPTMALKEFLLAEKADEDDARVQNGIGQAYYYKRAYNEAEKHYLRAIALSEDNPQYQNNLAACYLTAGRLDDAIRYFTAAASNLLFARSEIAWSGAGNAQLQKKAYVEALDSFNSALAVNRRFAPAYYYRGEAYDALDKSDKAVEDYRKAIEYEPNYADAHFKLGLALLKQRDTPGAVKAFNQVVMLAPDTEIGKQAANYLKVLH